MNGFMDKISEKILPLSQCVRAKPLPHCITRCVHAFFSHYDVWFNRSGYQQSAFFNDATKGTLSTLFGNGQMQQ